MNTHNIVPAAARRRKLTLASSVAALSLMAVAGFEASSSAPAYANTVKAPVGASAIDAPTSVAPASFADLVEKVKPAVIAVEVRITEQDGRAKSFGRNGNGNEGPLVPNLPFMPRGETSKRFDEALGSGFFISADGYAVTNNHVVDKANTVSITTDDGKSYSAKVVGTDPKTDLALIKVDGRSDFPFVKLATAAPRIGDWVLAVGNPFGLGGTVTAGIVSARGRDIGSGPYDDFLQIDAPVNRGSSGGPTFDLSGNVVGVNTAIYSPSGGSIGIAFDIPATTVQSVVEQLKDAGKVTRGYIGAQIQTVTSDLADGLGLNEAKGALIASIAGDGPADKAGLKPGDAILGVNGQAIADAHEFARDIASLKPGDKASLSVWRDGATETIKVTVANPPGEKRVVAAGGEDSKSGGPKLGLSLAPARELGKGDTGLAIASIDPASPAAETDLRQGDVITSAAGKTVSTVEDVRKAVIDAKREGRRAVLLQIERDGDSHYVAVPFVG
jgi:serine protease Do